MVARIHTTTEPDSSPDTPQVTIRLSDLVRFVFASKVSILGGALIGVLLAVTMNYFITPQYRAYVVLSRSDPGSNNMQEALGSGLGQAAALAGLGGQVRRGEAEAAALLQSRETIGKFIDKENMLPILFAKQWDAATKQWKSDGMSGEERRQRAISLFKVGLLDVTRDRLTGILTISIEWRDRHQASDWANGLVSMANELWRQQVIDEADQSISYLTNELDSTSTLEVRDGIYRLIEANMKQRTVATVRRDLLFKVIDKAVAPLKNEIVRPRRLFNLVLGFVAGTLAGLFLAFLKLIRR
jgi:uncharacterized protein involved in exopolysaccharide biosynthesis